MANEYNLHIMAKQIEATEGMKQHILDKLTKLEKLTDTILDVYVRLEVEKKVHHNVAITLQYAHTKIQAHASSTDLYASMDMAVDKLVHKVRKWKSKIQEHHVRVPDAQEIDVEIHETFDLEDINDQIEEQNRIEEEERFSLPKVAKKKKIPLKMLTTEEAMMKMELSNDHFMLFRAEDDQRLKVIYRRRDSSYGVITPE